MKFKIPKSWIFNFAERLSREFGIDEDTIEADLESLVYEAGEKDWDEYQDDYGDNFYYIDWDLD